MNRRTCRCPPFPRGADRSRCHGRMCLRILCRWLLSGAFCRHRCRRCSRGRSCAPRSTRRAYARSCACARRRVRVPGAPAPLASCTRRVSARLPCARRAVPWTGASPWGYRTSRTRAVLPRCDSRRGRRSR